MVASVGLNANSTAVIIGAMLISPLMEPIRAVGYGAAIEDAGVQEAYYDPAPASPTGSKRRPTMRVSSDENARSTVLTLRVTEGVEWQSAAAASANTVAVSLHASRTLSEPERTRLEAWLRVRAGTESVRLFVY